MAEGATLLTSSSALANLALASARAVLAFSAAVRDGVPFSKSCTFLAQYQQQYLLYQHQLVLLLHL